MACQGDFHGCCAGSADSTNRGHNRTGAKLIGTNDKQIRRAIYARELPAVRLGKSYSIAIADLTKWFERKKKFV